MLETLNLAALLLTIALVVVGGPIIFRRHNYPWNKVIFGTVTVLLVALALIAMLATVQTKTGLQLPLLWLVPPVTIAAGLFGQRAIGRFFQM